MNDLIKAHRDYVNGDKEKIVFDISTDKLRKDNFFVCAPMFIIRVFAETWIEQFN